MSNFGRPLAHVAVIPPYPPGRPVDAVAREFGLDPATIVKLASNENPLGCSSAAAQAIADHAGQAHIYPDFDCYDLRHALARHCGVRPDQVLPGAGSSELILLVARAFLENGRNAVMPQFSFQAYESCTKSVGADTIIVPVDDWIPDVARLLAAITTDTRLLYLATLNNPTGTLFPPEDLEQLVTALPEHVVLVLDEAYREFTPPDSQPDVLAMLARRRNMLSLRTFSKIHGLAGLRVGYALGDPELLQTLRKLQLPFSVNSIAQAAAIAALGDTNFIRRAYENNLQERGRLAEALAERGYRQVPSQGNFILFHVGDGATTARELMRRGVIVRPVGNYGLSEWLRVSVGLPHENERFLDALDDVRATALAVAS